METIQATQDRQICLTPSADEPYFEKAVVGCDGNGNGCVIWHVGSALDTEINDVGQDDLRELGLDDAPQGISIWEGVGIWYPDEDGDGSMELKGEYRKPTDGEWVSIRNDKHPWQNVNENH